MAGLNAQQTGSNGRYIYGESSELTTYGDVLFTYQQQFTNFSVNASVGASINDYTGNGTEMCIRDRYYPQSDKGTDARKHLIHIRYG